MEETVVEMSPEAPSIPQISPIPPHVQTRERPISLPGELQSGDPELPPRPSGSQPIAFIVRRIIQHRDVRIESRTESMEVTHTRYSYKCAKK